MTTLPLIQDCVLIAIGTIGFDIAGEVVLSGNLTDAATAINVNADSIAYVLADEGNTYSGTGTVEPLASDRAAWDALNYSTRHTNDIDDSPIAIHHTLGTGADQAAAGDHTHTTPGVIATSAIAEYASTNISNPPTSLEIDSSFGLANVTGPGFLGVINDNAAESSIYLAASTGYNWYYMNLTKAAISALLLAFLASDTYTGANGTHLNVHTMDVGGGWTENVGSWTISSNAAVQGTSTGSGVLYIATTETSQANLHLTVKVKTSYASGAGSAGIIARFSDTSNYWLIYCNWDGGEVTIREINAGVSTQRATKSWTRQYQKSVQIDINLSGNTIAATFDGGYSLSYTSSFNNTATKHGIAEVRETGTPYQANAFDDFQAIGLAANPWTRQGTVKAASGEPTVLYDSSPLILTGDKVFKLWYGAGTSPATINYAESADGVTWTDYGSNPIISNLVRGRVTKYDGVYYLYASYNDVRIDLYTSDDGVTWTLDTSNVLAVGTAGAWDDGNIANSFIWQDAPNDWRMLYEARTGSGPWHIGYATSADGRTWSKSGSNPVLSEVGSTGRPFVKKVGSYYYLWCHRSSAGGLPLYLVRYRSQNLTAWTMWPEAVIIPRVGSGEGEDTYVGQASDMTIMEYNGQAYLYFVGIDDGTGPGPSHIVLATANLAAIYDY